MIALLLCMSLLSGCASTKLTHPETEAEIRCYWQHRFTVGDVPAYDYSRHPWWLLIPPIGWLYSLGGGFYRSCIDDAEAHGFVRK